MNEPWGIAGQEFLKLYLVGLAFALLFALAVRIMVRAGSVDSRAASATVQPGQLSVHELAYLAGSTRRVVETAVARLIDQGKLRPTRLGTVRVAEGSTASDPVEQAVLADVTRYKDRSLGLLVDKVCQDAAVRAHGETLASKGLLVGEAAVRARWGVLPLAVLFVVGGARWVNGVSLGRPVGWLTLALAVTAIVAVLLYRRPLPERSYAGDRVLKEAVSSRSASDGGRGPAVDIGARGEHDVLLMGAVGAVAFGGLAMYPDDELTTAYVAHQAAASSSGSWFSGGDSSGSSWWGTSSSGSSCGSGGGSSCGGGGSSCGGGGGGGGCGG